MPLRKIATLQNPSFEVLNNQDGSFTAKQITTFKTHSLTFKLGEEFNEDTPDGRKVKVRLSYYGWLILLPVEVRFLGRPLQTLYIVAGQLSVAFDSVFCWFLKLVSVTAEPDGVRHSYSCIIGSDRSVAVWLVFSSLSISFYHHSLLVILPLALSTAGLVRAGAGHWCCIGQCSSTVGGAHHSLLHRCLVSLFVQG